MRELVGKSYSLRQLGNLCVTESLLAFARIIVSIEIVSIEIDASGETKNEKRKIFSEALLRSFTNI